MAMRKGITAVQRGSCERVYRDYRPIQMLGSLNRLAFEEKTGGDICNCRNIKTP